LFWRKTASSSSLSATARLAVTFWWRGIIHSKGARTADASTPIGPRAHAVESKAVVHIEVAVSPRPCLGCAVELVLLRVAPDFFFKWWRGLIHSKGARTAAASTPVGPRARL
jgi:hypothetical protein